ncbi:hypothetical protein EBS02_06730 [bacterium]|nr:hypothetical protein [bacterium]
MKLNGRKVVDAQVDGIDASDYPDFCDAYFSYAVFLDTGVELTEFELDKLTEKYPDVIYEKAVQFC